MRSKTIALELTIPVSGQRLAASYDPGDCRLFLQRLIARTHRSARDQIDPVATRAIAAEAARLEAILLLVEKEVGETRRGAL